jgi:hypothetical protein
VNALELSEETKARLAQLQALSEQAEDGDKDARRELRRALRESSPEVVARCSDFARKGQAILSETVAVGEPLMEEAVLRRLDLMRVEVAGEDSRRGSDAAGGIAHREDRFVLARRRGA